ncbi:Rhodanese-like domain-containing protein [Mucor mucedo]|uniref:Rhodanese-like domain-containing protein n=1 Tax=Mucor mucedo TaxID=29922 RepID=UPI0022210279|nr:Rhodanese-like domain-containing protein [Mucor mucedo]KAI7882128.1 Rhodanese-like domain-containing protein [Mucor mucedo]
MTIGIHNMTVEELATWLQDKPAHATFIDVREYAELEEQGVISGYDGNIPWFLTNTNSELFDQKFSAIDKDEQLVISCRSGRRSGFAAEYVVSKLGFTNVYNVKGGILDWIGHGYPVEQV